MAYKSGLCKPAGDEGRVRGNRRDCRLERRNQFGIDVIRCSETLLLPELDNGAARAFAGDPREYRKNGKIKALPTKTGTVWI
jgi:hypothetical protein